jgi:hypothetical protein
MCACVGLSRSVCVCVVGWTTGALHADVCAVTSLSVCAPCWWWVQFYGARLAVLAVLGALTGVSVVDNITVNYLLVGLTAVLYLLSQFPIEVLMTIRYAVGPPVPLLHALRRDGAAAHGTVRAHASPRRA